MTSPSAGSAGCCQEHRWQWHWDRGRAVGQRVPLSSSSSARPPDTNSVSSWCWSAVTQLGTQWSWHRARGHRSPVAGDTAHCDPSLPRAGASAAQREPGWAMAAALTPSRQQQQRGYSFCRPAPLPPGFVFPGTRSGSSRGPAAAVRGRGFWLLLAQWGDGRSVAMGVRSQQALALCPPCAGPAAGIPCPRGRGVWGPVGSGGG